MAKRQLIGKLKEGHTIIGRVISKDEGQITLEAQNGDQFKLPLTKEFITALGLCEADEPLLEITMKKANSADEFPTYHVYELDVWPDEKSKT